MSESNLAMSLKGAEFFIYRAIVSRSFFPKDVS